MYFLAKNIRNCSRSFRSSPDKAKLYQNGILNWEYLAKKLSYFVTHPEQIKSKLKEKDAHMLCQFFDSDEYKSRVSQFLEMQEKILSKDTISGIKPPGSVTYQHVLSCAQPNHKKPKVFMDVEEPPEPIMKIGEERRRKVKRCTIFEELLNRKGKTDMQKDSDCVSVKSESKPKRFRQRSTIMPIFLKKIKQRHQQEDYEIEDEPGDAENMADFTDQTARRLRRFEDEEPLFAQILHRSNMPKLRRSSSQLNISAPRSSTQQQRPQTASSLEMRSSTTPYRLQSKEPSRPVPAAVRLRSASYRPDSTREPDKVSYRFSSRRNVLEPIDPAKIPQFKSNFSTSIDHSSKLEVVPLRMGSLRAKVPAKAPLYTEFRRKSMNLKSFSDFLCVEPVKQQKALKVEQTAEPKGVKVKVLKQKAKKKKTKKKPAIQLLMEQLQAARAWNLPENFQKESVMMKAQGNRKETRGARPMEVSSLFNKVKLEQSKSVLILIALPGGLSGGTFKDPRVSLRVQLERSKLATEERLLEQAFGLDVSLASLATILRGTSKRPEPVQESPPKPISLLDKVILKPRLVGKELKPKPSRHQQSFTYKIVAQNRERREAKLRKQFKINSLCCPVECQAGNAAAFGHKRLPTALAQPKLADENRSLLSLFRSAQKPKRYLVRLPKTTPEGYRVLLYSVRDPDPTKMNFNDVVKGFCMYNDCVLSEDGLQEGYIVIFDMKDVCLGHLARVSLPALKCFMYYIQDAHPCRLKQIHVLNTATWIHHVMRLVVPLVRSELLNLVRFHKGSIPDGFPTELLPMDYGGEAPTVEDLDTITKALLGKYRDWLVESEHLKADESKRVKRGSWWGFLTNKSPQQVELDEKTILKNLQID
ncbi:hypothetical protein HUJ05_005895 [Dendroctonus ponderosae]|nr:hypothetical protein HUJ05_005895 [Dendroctonus ponderosae]